jgi:hypothetical protein
VFVKVRRPTRLGAGLHVRATSQIGRWPVRLRAGPIGPGVLGRVVGRNGDRPRRHEHVIDAVREPLPAPVDRANPWIRTGISTLGSSPVVRRR